jgi:HEPN domain-containing protein
MADVPLPGAKAWMIKAWRDLETARRVAEGKPPFYDVAVYHCQQAAEKAVKAFLLHHGKTYEQTHDIEVAVDLASEIDPSFSKLSDAADALTP